jgi:large subunit ribosomal protein L5
MADVKKTAKPAEKVEKTEKPAAKKADTKANTKASAKAYAPRLKKLYQEQFVAELEKELNLTNVHIVPKLTKIVVSSGVGRNKDNKAFQATVENTLLKITGQKPVARLAKKSIATFKIRKAMGAPVGISVTLRGDRMWEFLDRLVNVAMPRIRDFHGAGAKGFDAQGNYNLGLTEQSIFPELTFEETTTLHGLGVTFRVANGTKENSRALLEKFGIPFEKGAN